MSEAEQLDRLIATEANLRRSAEASRMLAQEVRDGMH
jgi:hypothetical protein